MSLGIDWDVAGLLKHRVRGQNGLLRLDAAVGCVVLEIARISGGRSHGSTRIWDMCRNDAWQPTVNCDS